ncbi:hypothetical protein B0H15DRAFT_828257 [Mycena belliarum]|uniref:WKF domain-containing protein n=1 Tax=Mycena belliarum TaxID=1033014 RepID=A0AAD6UBD2_9AGAR|nr:hypothetical protein B0H15DRAFT_828257 [Mycena belliae]
MTEEGSVKSQKRERGTTSDGSKTARKSQKEKRKREDATAENTSPENIELNSKESSPEPLKKKRKKNKTGFPDPADDPALSEQATKALSYAFSQFHKPSKWKFSKARQNWLCRNIWSETIPDPYLLLTIRYLSNVKGGVREALIKDCSNILSVPPTPDKPTSTETVPAQQDEGVGTTAAKRLGELKLARARALLDVLEAKSQPDHQS